MPELRILALVGASGVGKTTVLSDWSAYLTSSGYRIGCFKHSHHPFPAEPEGKDSARLARSRPVWSGWAGVGGLALAGELAWEDLVEWLAARSSLDLVLIEGGKRSRFPKLEVVRAGFPRLDGVSPLACVGDEGLPWGAPEAWTSWWQKVKDRR